MERLLKGGGLAQTQEFLHLPTHSVRLAADQKSLKDSIAQVYEQGGLTPPNFKDALETLGLDPRRAQPLYKLLLDEGRIARIKEDMYFAGSALDALKTRVLDYFAANAELGPQEFRELTGLSRKFAIPLMEYLDKEIDHAHRR